MTLSETTYTVGSDGTLVIPRQTIEQMGLQAGGLVSVAYLSADGQQNSFREFMLTPDGITNIDTDEHIAIPTALLEQAGIADNSDVQVICGDGAIILCADPVMHANELREVLMALEIAEKIISQLPCDPDGAIAIMQDALDVEGADEYDGAN